MIYDCINFFDELELLDLRLHELNSVVDYFVIVESTVTFTNRPEPLLFKANKKRFKEFSPKIIHVVVDDCPNVTLPWIIEHFEFSSVMRGLKNARPKDTILLSCTDELPNKDAILKYRNSNAKHKMFDQRFYLYYLNCEAYGKGSSQGCTSMFSYKDLLSYPDPYVARFTPPDLLIPNGGWHFRNLGGVKRIQEKLASWSHQEYNNSAFNTPEHLLKRMRQGEDFFNTGLKYRFVPYSHLPFTVTQNLSSYQEFLVDPAIYSPLSIFELLYLDSKRLLRLAARAIISPFRS